MAGRHRSSLSVLLPLLLLGSAALLPAGRCQAPPQLKAPASEVVKIVLQQLDVQQVAAGKSQDFDSSRVRQVTRADLEHHEQAASSTLLEEASSTQGPEQQQQPIGRKGAGAGTSTRGARSSALASSQPAAAAGQRPPPGSEKGNKSTPGDGGSDTASGAGGGALPLSEPPPPITHQQALPRSAISEPSSGSDEGEGPDAGSPPNPLKALGNPSCVWLAEQKQCMPTQDNWLIPKGSPSSPLRRANLMAIARQRHCDGYAKEGPCWEQSAFRCYWYNGKDGSGECRSADMLELYYFASQGFAASLFDIPLSMTCPGTPAYDFFKCFGHPVAQRHCEKLEGCFMLQTDSARPAVAAERAQREPISRRGSESGAGPGGGGSDSSGSSGSKSNSTSSSGGGGGGAKGSQKVSLCLPKKMASMSSKELSAFVQQLGEMDDKVSGNCAAACWLKEARLCRMLRATSKRECELLPFCSFDRSEGACLHRVMEFSSNFDYRVKRLYGLCLEIDNEQDCKLTELTKPKPAVDWKAYRPTAAAVKCMM